MMDAPLNLNEAGYLGSFLSNSLKTHQLEVNTDSKTLRPIARLKEPRELFALPKERDYDCPQQAPRWPIECQVLEERVYHLDDAPETPEPYYQPTGKELQPRPVGEENGIIVYNYNPTSAVHYSGHDDDDPSELEERRKGTVTDGGGQRSWAVPLPPMPSAEEASFMTLRQLRMLRRRLLRQQRALAARILHWEQSEYDDYQYSYDEMNDAREIRPYDEENGLWAVTPEPGLESVERCSATLEEKVPGTGLLLQERGSNSPSRSPSVSPMVELQVDEQHDGSKFELLQNPDMPRKSPCGVQEVEPQAHDLRSDAQDIGELESLQNLGLDLPSRSSGILQVESKVEDVGELESEQGLNLNSSSAVLEVGSQEGELETLHHLNLNMPSRCMSGVLGVETQVDDLRGDLEQSVDGGRRTPTTTEADTDSPETGSSSPPAFRQRQPRQHTATSNDFYSDCDNESEDSEGEQSALPRPPAPLGDDDDRNNASADGRDALLHPPTTITHSPASDLCPQFSRSTVGGSKAQPAAHPTPLDPDDLVFESRFESGNLGRAIKITPTYYELYLRPDMYTNRHTQWFYFQVKNTKAKVVYRFSIINLTKPDSLYKEGMRPLMYSTTDAECNQVGWRRCGENIAYFRNEDSSNGYNYSHYHHRPADDDEDEYIGTSSFTLSFNIEFKYDGDTVYFAHSYPYTYSDLQDYLMCIQRNPVKSKFCKLRLLCRSLAGNNVYYLTVTAPTTHEDDNQKKKKAVIITARVHPGESPSSWMMKGLMDFITGDSYVAKKLRHKFIFKLVPMLNPDGVIVGNTRSSLTGRDLNRQYRTVIRETYPSIWNTKAMIRRLMEDCGVAMYCDMHAHSRKHNVFIYGCENLKRHPDRRLLEQVFPLMLHKNVADKFSFENCKFKVQKNKEGTGRIVVWVLGVTNSYTLEASFGGSTMGGRAGTHFSTADFEHIGRAYCETLMDYYDDNPIKRVYRRKVRQCLWFVLNLYHPEVGPPCDEAIQRRFQHFLRIPVPRTPEEQEAHRREQAATKAKTTSIQRVKRTTNTTTAKRNDDSEPDQEKGRRRKVVLVVRKRTVQRKPPPVGETEQGGQQAATFTPEKLRMKILTRLSKEGSSAEEPLNIPLSDYSSDEGDTSSSSSEDEGKDSMAELEGPCCSTLKVPPSSPVLPQKLKGNKKNKKQIAQMRPAYRRKSHSVQRIVLDIPTTEPASDFVEYTSEDELLPPAAVSDTENTIKRTFRRRNRPRKTDNIRKLTLLGCETQYLMPPELIVRSAANRYHSEDEDEQSKMVMSIIKEFPPVLGKERVWQRSSGSERTIDAMKSSSPDNYQVRFSLKRSIWMGTHSDGYVNDCYVNPRPISWGAPPTLVKSTHYDNEALLTACSQKLAAWKDEKRSLKEKHHKSSLLKHHHSHAIVSNKDKENRSVRVKIAVGSEQFAAAAAAAAAAKQRYTAGPIGDKKQPVDGTEGSGITRVKRKTRSTLSKIVEKAEIITHLSRSARVGQTRRLLATGSLSTAGSPRKALLSVPSATTLATGVVSNTNGTANGVNGTHGPTNVVPSPVVKNPSKFKTSGIVVTAAQPLPKMRKSLAARAKSTASPIKLPTTSIDIQLTTLCSETESERNVKVVTGKKHKKKRTPKDKPAKLPC